MMEGLLNADQAAKILGISKSMVYLLATSGRLKKVKIGACLRFKREHLEQYIERCTEEEREPVTA